MSDVEVATTAGVLRGRRHGDVRMWRGIPYAAPPVGTQRLRAPQPHPPWTGVREAAEFGPAAPQRSRLIRSDEDCLTLNIVAPLDSSSPRTVLVYFHGGAYVTGSSRLYRGENLVRRGDVVYVAANYRLGALGYLDFREFSTPQRQFDVNCGLRDQVAALEWVRDNIAGFGGDPNSVMIFGESSGGNAVTTLLCAPSARGLFHRAIAQSSPAASVYSPQRAQRWAHELVGFLGGAADPAGALTSATPEAMVEATHRLTMAAVDTDPGTRATAPVVDGEVLPKHPFDAFADGSAAPVPLIIGSNAHEGRFFPRFLDVLPTTPARIEKMFAETDPDVKSRVLAAYRGFPKPQVCADLGGDVVFWEPSVLVAQSHSRHAPTYAYRYDFAPRLFDVAGFGATHGTELVALFNAGGPVGRVATVLGGRHGLRTVSDVIQSHWLQFAHHGEPGPGWTPYTEDRRTTLIIDKHPHLVDDPNRALREAWIGYKHRR
ncbi:MAG TPA: carboxylesterase/lipase family protein [Aldersonia sp.]